jgi:hypothetical protein
MQLFKKVSTATYATASKTIAAAFFGAAMLHTLPAAAASDDSSLWQQTKTRLGDIAGNGTDSLYLSGWAHHGRDTYTREKLNELNEKSWGGGYGRTLRNASGNDESLYAMAISDSHKQPQIMAGYAYEWIWPIASTGLEAGLGYTGMLMSRQDYFGGVPFPIALPLASIGANGTKVMASYVPRLSHNKGNGDVLFMFLRVELR